MLSDNPFSELAANVSPALMQAYVVVMICLVAGGTIYDMSHKRSADYFFANWRRANDRGSRKVGPIRTALLAAQTAGEALVSGEFCSARRRIAHLLTMYGFLAYAIATIVLVFVNPNTPAPAYLPLLWRVGALMVCIGGYWFWFFIRVDVSAEGNSPFRIVHADLFILSLLASTTLALVWSSLEAAGSAWTNTALVLYLVATTFLFASVAWSKFSHMFYKPAAALQKRVEAAAGTRENLPLPAKRPKTLGTARTQPSHY